MGAGAGAGISSAGAGAGMSSAGAGMSSVISSLPSENIESETEEVSDFSGGQSQVKISQQNCAGQSFYHHYQ